VHLLNLRTLPLTGEVLLRLTHIYAVGEDPVLSKPAQVNLASLFKNLRVTKISEMNLSANQLKSEVKRYKWKTASTTQVRFSGWMPLSREGTFDYGYEC
jgi:hypothetical protein